MNIQTDRVLIREIEPEAWKSLKNIAIDFKNSKYVIYDMPLPVEDEEIKMQTKQFAGSHMFFAVYFKYTAEMIGYVCFHSDYHVNGYAVESCMEDINI